MYQVLLLEEVVSLIVSSSMVIVGASYTLLETLTRIPDSLIISRCLLFIKTDSKHGTRVIDELTGRRFAEEKTCMQ